MKLLYSHTHTHIYIVLVLSETNQLVVEHAQ